MRSTAALGENGVVNGSTTERLAFEKLERERRSEINLHCYRMLGSLSDAEDLTQETFARAWRARAELVSQSSSRAWLYRIATNACVDALRGRKRKRRLWGNPEPLAAGADLGPPDLHIKWIEPLPDTILSNLPDSAPGPEAAFEQAEAVRLAFLAAIQLLPARQRAIFLLREVLGWSASEVATAFEMTPQAANSQLQRARKTFDSAYLSEPNWTEASDFDQQIAEKYALALEKLDLDGFVSLLLSDATLHMPPWREWFRGRDAIKTFLAKLWSGYSGYRTSVLRANGRFAIAVYAQEHGDERWQPHAVQILEISNGSVASIIAFVGSLSASLFSDADPPP